MTIDTHIHLYDTQRPQGVPFPKPEDRRIYRPMLPADLRQVAEPAGVRGAVVIEASPWIEDNDWVLDLVANEPFICAVVGNLDPEAVEFPTLLERFARNPRFRGVRIRQGRPLAFDHPHLRGHLLREPAVLFHPRDRARHASLTTKDADDVHDPHCVQWLQVDGRSTRLP